MPDDVPTTTEPALEGEVVACLPIERVNEVCRFDASERFQYPARVAALANLDELTKLLTAKRIADSQVLAEHPPYFFSAEISSNRVDAYFTRMEPATTLKNFRDEANNGVAFLNSHDGRRLPFGYSLQGRFITGSGNGVARTEADFYTLLGTNTNGVSSDDLVTGIRGGLIRDVSVGFHGGQYICDVCGRDLWRDWNCPHVPGVEYDAATMGRVDEKTTEKILATATIRDAHLAEVSAVYDGATPGAAILKAQQEIDLGRARPEMVRMLEARYRIRLSVPPTVVTVPLSLPAASPASSPDPEDRMDKETPPGAPERSPEFVRLMTRAREVAAFKIAEGATPPTDEAVLERLIETAGRVPDLDARVAELGPQAEDGKAYRAAMVAETWTEYNRAGLAEGVVEADQQALWNRQPLPEVLKLKEQYTVLAKARLQSGRQTTDGEPDPNRGHVAPSTPTWAHRA